MELALCQWWPYFQMSINIATEPSKPVWKFMNWTVYANSQIPHNGKDVLKRCHIQQQAVGLIATGKVR